MRNYFVTFRSSRHPISWEYDYDPEDPNSDPSPPNPGKALIAETVAKLASPEIIMSRVDSTSFGWFSWCAVNRRSLCLSVGAVPDGDTWWISCENHQGVIGRLLRGSNDAALRHLAEVVDTFLHNDPTFTEIRWYERYPEGPYGDHPGSTLR